MDKIIFIFNTFLFKSTQATGLMMAFTFFQTTLHLRNRSHTSNSKLIKINCIEIALELIKNAEKLCNSLAL